MTGGSTAAAGGDDDLDALMNDLSQLAPSKPGQRQNKYNTLMNDLNPDNGTFFILLKSFLFFLMSI